MNIETIGKNLKMFLSMPGEVSPRHGVILSVLTVFFVLFGAMFIPFRMNLVLETKDHRLLHGWAIKPGDQFVITYLHSVNKSPVEEYFLIEKDYAMQLTKTSFRAFGVGIPCEPEAGQAMRYYRDHIEIVNINREIPQILLAVGLVANHQLTVSGHKRNLTDFAQPQQTVKIYPRRVSAYELIKERLK